MGLSPGGEIKILHATQVQKKKHKSVYKFALKIISYQRPKLDVIVCTHQGHKLWDSWQYCNRSELPASSISPTGEYLEEDRQGVSTQTNLQQVTPVSFGSEQTEARGDWRQFTRLAQQPVN